MDENQLEEFTQHLAAGADPLTAYAGTRGKRNGNRKPGRYCLIVCLAILGLGTLTILLMK